MSRAQNTIMHFLFWLSPDIRRTRTAALTLAHLNDSAGFSGTETCLMELASHVARRRGHRCTVVGDYRGDENQDDECTRLTHTTDAGVLHATGLAADVDVVIPMFAIEDRRFQDLFTGIRDARLAVGRDPPTLIVWCHCFLMGNALDQVVRWRDAGGRVGLVGVSDWLAETMAPWAVSAALPYITIENAMSPAVFGDDRDDGAHVVVRKPLSFVFHATYERGGDVARRVARRVGGAFDVASYDTNDDARAKTTQDAPFFHGSLSKRRLARLLRASDYFVYPLVLPDGRVHHDTYGCVVLEALACGVLVVTWDVACMRAVYGDSPAVVLVPPPLCRGYDPRAPFGFNDDMLSDRSVDALATAVQALEALPAEGRERMRVAGRAWALRHTWEDRADRLMAWLHGGLLLS